MRPLRLLVIGLPSLAPTLAAHLRTGERTVDMEITDPDERSLREALLAFSPDLVLCGSAGGPPDPDVLVLLSSLAPSTPAIAVAPAQTLDCVTTAMRFGARDYVTLDDLSRLARVADRELGERGRASLTGIEAEGLRKAETRFQRLYDSALVGVFSGHASGAILDANDTFLALIGSSRDELRAGRLTWSDLTPPEWQPAAEEARRELLAKGVVPAWESEYLRRDGSLVPVLVGLALVEPTETIVFVVDLTRQKEAERALRESESDLRQAQKMEALGRLAGGISHDFNNLLSVILSYSRLASNDLRPDDPLRRDLDAIHEAGTRAAELTKQLLAFSRRQVLAPRVVDPGEIVLGMRNMLTRLVGSQVELAVEVAERRGRVLVDPTQLEQVLLNLVANGRDAMPTGGRLRIDVRNVRESEVGRTKGLARGAWVRLTVTDTGVGMDQETKARIFEPFYTTKPEGTGLGLATVFGVVQQSGGHVLVQSEVGRGTSIEVFLPRTDQPTLMTPMPFPVEKLLGFETILVVEDDASVRKITTAILERYGYRVMDAQNAGEALLLFEAHAGDIHLVLTDVVMPRVNGIELARRLRALREGLRVLYMTGQFDAAMEELDMEALVVRKPFTPDVLARSVREALR